MKDIKLLITESQEYLLSALVGKESTVKEYYDKWIASVNMESYIDGESYRLLPMLYKKLSSLGINDDNMNRYKGIYKKSFFKNSIHLHHLYHIGKKLNHSGIPFTVIKGLAILLRYQKDNGTRAMNDIDLLVEKKDISATVEIIKSSGFTETSPFDIHQNMKTRHSYAFKDQNDFEIDLHWQAVYLHYHSIKLTETETIRYKEITVQTLTPENQIINTLIHAANCDPFFIIRWVTDIHTILANERQIQWDFLLEKIKTTAYCYTFYLMLLYFNKVSSILIPDRVLILLKEAGNTRENHKNAVIMLQKPKNLLASLHFYHYSKMNKDKNIVVRIIKFPDYILKNSKYPTFWQLFKAFFFKYILKKKA